ncbi:MAG: hypothetical protein KDK99_16930 [Verrucomicrobiales bacterium]|nr:hypothetical protein [Verrucomicrobiales bacterium]
MRLFSSGLRCLYVIVGVGVVSGLGVAEESEVPERAKAGEAQVPDRVVSESQEEAGKLKAKTLYKVSGPWGDLEYYMIYVTAPDEYLKYWPMPTEVTEWYFGRAKAEDAQLFIRELNISDERIDGEQPSARFFENAGDLILYPNRALVLSLTDEQRQRVAERLVRDPRNRFYTDPVVVESGDPETWFRDAGLNEETVSTLAKLCYRRGSTVLFSDVPYALSRQKTLEERRNLVRAITRTRSLVLRLAVGGGSKMEDIVNYWTAGHKRKDLLPILRSVVEVPEVERIDVVHLLPPTPRMLLYTFPSLASAVTGELKDCHWTSTNFFREVPEGVISEWAVRGERMFAEMEPATGEPRFGDTIVLYERETDRILHSMTYIAADVVFTKNGNSLFRPWVLMRYADVVARFAYGQETVARIFRPTS